MLEMKEYEIDFVKESISFYEVINEEESSNKNKKSVLEKIKKMLLKIKNFLVNIYKKFKKFIVNLFNKITGYSKKEEAFIAEIDKLKKENEKMKKVNSDNYNIYSSELDRMKKTIEKKEKELADKERESKKKDSTINDLEKSRKYLNNLNDTYERELRKNKEEKKKEFNDIIISKKKALSEIKIKDGYEGIIGRGSVGLLKELSVLNDIKDLFMGIKDEVNINSSVIKVKRSVRQIDELISNYRNYKSSLKIFPANEVINENNAANIRYKDIEKIDKFTNNLKLFSKDMDKIYKEVEKELNEDLERSDEYFKAANDPESDITREDIDSLNKFIASNSKKLNYINFLNTEISYVIPTIITERKNILKAVKLGIEIETLQYKLDLLK
ncbi:hypothetical protein [Staphylococcus phage vB_StaM_PB50]|nr:hypothetical protein [Staphylococcus phage vB_StaM_PB50]